MSNPENFINEVTEEVRRDRLFGYLRRYGWIAVVLVIGLVVAAGLREWQRAQGRESAEDFGDALSSALAASTPAGRAAGLADLRGREAGARAALADLLAAGQEVAAGDRPAALARLQAIAADAGLPAAWRDMARLRQVMLAGSGMPVAERRLLLDELARPGAAFRPLALEQQALIALEEGDAEEARAALAALIQEPDLTAGLRRRAEQLMVALGAAPAGG